ncbi:hypothetical protein FACS189465_0820 [Clostridia bacterium]|nr:hypothetical protein FACS189465_0820 [Clostridia bacterium]
MSPFEDKTLVCKDCGNEFLFTAGEQEFYVEKGFENEPQRCKGCRDARKNSGRAPRPPGERRLFIAVCASCGGEAKVPFEPRDDRPVYCSECFANIKESPSFANNGGNSGFTNNGGNSGFAGNEDNSGF